MKQKQYVYTQNVNTVFNTVFRVAPSLFVQKQITYSYLLTYSNRYLSPHLVKLSSD